MSKKLLSLIVDDENKSCKNLSILLEEFCPEVEVMDKASTAEEAVQKINRYEPDLVFLDIQLDTDTGFDVLKKVKEVEFDVIFTTAYSQYAIEAIRCSALDYILKPINIAHLQEAVARAYQRKDESSLENRLKSLWYHLNTDHHKPSTTIALPSSEGLKFIHISNIVYLKAEGSYTKVFTENHQQVMVTKNLKEFESQLLPNNFFRIHHSYLVNLEKINKYVKGEGGQVEMNNGSMLDVSKRRKPYFLKKMEG